MERKERILVAFGEKGLGRQYTIGPDCKIGRLADCQVQILDTQVSKHHARIFAGAEAEAETYFIEDLGSLNGVLLNGERIRKPTKLSPNDVIVVGGHGLLFEPDWKLLPQPDSDRAVVLLADEATVPSGSSAPASQGRVGALPAEFLEETLSLLAHGEGVFLEDILTRFRALVAFDTAGILLAKEGKADRTLCVCGESRTLAVPLSIANLALADRKGIRLPDALDDPAFRKGKDITEGKIRSLLVAPLCLKEEAVGVACLTKGVPDFYTGANLEMLLHAAPLLALAASQARQMGALRRKIDHQTERAGPPQEICGRSRAVEELKNTIAKVAPTMAPVLITGETGTGKELVAAWLHALGPGPSQPFVAVNCGAVPEGLAESEFMGHEKGSFSGADRMKPGKLELATSGTLFLDEIGELSLAIQAKLLRALELQHFHRVGGISPVDTDFRLVAATNRDLQAQVQAGNFREDLFFRLRVITIEIPPLRARPEDIEPLLRFFIEKFNREFGTRVRGMERLALKWLTAYSWPGNIRELRNVVERMVALSDRKVITREQLPAEILSAVPAAAPEGIDFVQRVEAFERALLILALRTTGGKKRPAAKLLGITRPTLAKKIEEYGLEDAVED